MNRSDAKDKAKKLVSQMTVEEVSSQLRVDSPAIRRLGVPEYNWWNECLHGVARAGTATVFPQAIGLGASFDAELMSEVGDCISTEARAKYNEYIRNNDNDIYKGLTFWAPNVNLFRDPRWGRGQETYGEDPYLISRLAVSFIKGLQGDGEHMKIAACAKHFAVHSGPESLRHGFNAICSLKDLRQTYIPAFEACVKEADVEAVMGAYNRTNDEPCCAHSYIKDIIRDEWGFEGHFVSDCWAIRDFHEHHKITNKPEESAALALNKGCDLNCGCTYAYIMKAFNKGLVSEDVIRESAVRLFTTRYMLGMFEDTEYDNLNYLDVETKEHVALSKKAADESIVLLKNDGILPISREKTKVISVIGPNADSRRALMGNYYGTASEYITAIEGIRAAAGDDIRILYSEGCDLGREKPDFLSREYNRLAEARAVMERSDVVILCIGLDETLEGEEGDEGNQFASGDKPDMSFPKPQQKLIDCAIQSGKPLVVVVMAGSAMDLNLLSEHSSAIMQAWYPGECGGSSIGDVIFGNVNPSGKLPVTIYKSIESLPDFTDYSMKGRTYRFLEQDPLYPFGFGLTYGDIRIESVKAVSSSGRSDVIENGIKLSVTVTNKSDCDISEVLQVYAKAIDDKDEVLNSRLVAFRRINLEAGSECEFTIDVPSGAFILVDDAGNKKPADGTVELYVGFGQPDKRTYELTNKHSITIPV